MATIAAVSTGLVQGGIAVVRVSGPEALAATLPLVPGVPKTPAPRHAYATAVTDSSGRPLDEGLFLYFAAPRSATGEDVVELHLHGSPALAALVVSEVVLRPGVRRAEAGEFTRRAFVNGRIDLLRAEAVADLISAESREAVQAAAGQLRGEVSEQIVRARASLEDVSADIEGLLDFPEEAVGAEDGLPGKLEAAAQEIDRLARGMEQSTRRRRGGRIVLFGPVNAGKSSLFNALLGEERALVDEAPGTTRDVLEAPFSAHDLWVTLVDTAGFRSDGDAPERIEALGIARARAALEGADVAVAVLPAEASAKECAAWLREVPEGVVCRVVRSKADSVPAAVAPPGALRVSVRTQEGVEQLKADLWQEFASGLSGAIGSGSARATAALSVAQKHMKAAQSTLEKAPLEVVAGELGLAREALDEALGRTADGAVLDAVFRRFCIGK